MENKLKIDPYPEVEVEEPTLMLAYERLHNRVESLEKLEGLSEKLISKFYRIPEPSNPQDKLINGLINKEEPNIIDIFDRLTDRIDRSTHNIGNNIENIINMIG